MMDNQYIGSEDKRVVMNRFELSFGQSKDQTCNRLQI